MKHRGEIIEKAIRESGIPLTNIAKKMGKTRQWLYLLFDNPNVSIDIVLEIGKIIHYDFNSEIEIFNNSQLLSDNSATYNENSVEHWKNKYYQLLEENHQLYLRISELEKK